MRLLVLILLSLSVEGSGSRQFLPEAVNILLNSIKTEERSGFRKVFPKNYEVSHHYDETLLCDDPCCVFRSAAVLSDSWSELLNVLWRENIKYPFINDLKKSLDEISYTKFHEPLDFSALPSVSSSPEVLLGHTEAVFSKWLKDELNTTNHVCTFPTLPGSEEEDEQHNRITEGKRTTPASPYVEQRKTDLSTEAQSADGTTSVRSLISIFGPLSLLWAAQQVIF
ncbi:hypothetical protein GN956_G21630 [Arapaima gigas]